MMEENFVPKKSHQNRFSKANPVGKVNLPGVASSRSMGRIDTSASLKSTISNSYLSPVDARGNIAPDFNMDVVLCQILEVQEDGVLLNCLLDKDSSDSEIRMFDKAVLQGVVKMEPGHIIKVEIYSRPGERRFVYKNASKKEGALFEKKLVFKSFEVPDSFITPEGQDDDFDL